MNQKTLLFLVRPEGQVLLAMKKRGFGEGKLNGVGGKVEMGETIEEAAVREAHEEIGVTISPENLLKRGFLHFSFETKPEWTQDVHVFFVDVWKGTPRETEEMCPAWYRIDAIPFDEMWVDDVHWLPRALGGEYIEARFHFSADGSGILSMDIN